MKAEKDTAVLYVHGKGGSAAEAEHYRALFPQAEVYGFDYRAETPWDAKEEFSARAAELRTAYSRVLLVANSIGAYFSMNAGLAKMVEKAWLISPIVNMERLILDMIAWAGTTVAELELNLRRYTVTEAASPLLPLTQALAIARRYAGAELSLGYLDGGGDALSAGWLAE